MRVAGFAFVGFLIGAIAGFLLALLFVTLWYDVLQIGTPGGDSLNGLATFMALAPMLVLAGGAGGAFWLGRRAHTGKRVMPFGIAILMLLLALFILLGSLVAF